MLGVKSDKFALMLYPLVESCLPINLLRIWERHLSSITFKSDEKFSKLETLMKFLGKEIEVEEKINLAKSGFGLDHKTKKNQPMKSSFNLNKNITTGMELYSSVQGSQPRRTLNVCADKNHSSTECSYSQDLPVEQRKRADVAGKLLTGGYKLLPSGLVAIETRLGWTVMGLTRREKGDENTGLIITSMLTREISETDLWNLDVIGIKDQAEKHSKMEQEEATRQHFLKTLKRLPEGRYENLLRNYEEVFHEWLKEDIIEPVNISRLDDLLCTYLPHRAVIKENSTTKIRPVFDASAKQKNGSSLNSCLEKGPNLLELIPSILNRFRLGTSGVIADIKKAFLQISIDYKNRDYLRFLWFENGDPDNLKIYRHERVVFGINASPFLFGATISCHLDNVPEHLQEVAKKLKTSMYVDNCVTSLDTIEEVESFIEQSKEIILSAKFDLRGWKYNEAKSTFHRDAIESPAHERNVSVLGLEWNTEADALRCLFLMQFQ
ncbi:hypothetical protein AVEN_184095-1 [Araneus ventricosus]|uniref:Reverse transcriptase domain-containing protein n=1 Tax=Araneus ventricosus TaxID=182803 RepID=A0A4Y2CY41_ARAVE|nr:hypothetical protein AVEN_184095-1 [Araneus ventricosus]